MRAPGAKAPGGFIAALAMALALPAGAGAQEISGYAAASLWATPSSDEKISTAGFRGLFALAGAAGERADYRISLEYAANGAGLADAGEARTEWYGPAAFSLSLADRATLDLALKEAWVSFYAGDFDFILGQQIVTWGQADGNNPTDNVNARYVGTRDATGSDEKKIAAPMVNAVWNLPSGKGTVQALFLPLPSVNRMPDMGGFIGEDRPGFSAENLEGGVRGLFYAGGASLSASYLTILDRYPSDVTEWQSIAIPFPPPGTIVDAPAELGHTRRHIFGLDGAFFLGSFDIRAEGAYTLTEDPDGADPYAKNPSVTAVLQGSRSFFDGRVSAALSWSPAWIQNFEKVSDDDLSSPAAQMFAGSGFEFEQALALRLQGKFLGETLQPEALFLTELAARDWLATAGATYNIADGWNLKAGLSLHGSFRSESDPLRQLGVFGSDAARDSDAAYLELRFDF